MPDWNRAPVLFVATTAYQTRSLQGVAEHPVLRAEGRPPHFLWMRHPHHAASEDPRRLPPFMSELSDAGFAVSEVGRSGREPSRPPRLLRPLSLWYFILRTLFPGVRAAFDRIAPSVVVLANDSGYFEKVVIREAARRGIPTLLWQQALAVPDDCLNRLQDLQRRAASRLARRGLAPFVPSPFGSGGASHVGVIGPMWVDVFAGRGRPRPMVRVVGPPKPAVSAVARAGRRTSAEEADSSDFTVVFLTTNLLSGLRDRRAHEAQVREIRMVRSVVTRLFGPRSRVLVKLHPSDRLEDHTVLLDDPALEVRHAEPLSDVLAEVDVAITTISFAGLRAVEAGIPCLALAVSPEGARYRCVMSRIPLPTIGSEAELADALGSLADPAARHESVTAIRNELDRVVSRTDDAAADLSRWVVELGGGEAPGGASGKSGSPRSSS